MSGLLDVATLARFARPSFAGVGLERARADLTRLAAIAPTLPAGESTFLDTW